MWLDRFRTPHGLETAVDISSGYQSRSTRFRLDVPISFAGESGTQEGQCLDVSDSGLLATFDNLPDLWTVGLLVLEAGEHYLSINARVARIEARSVGFAFLIDCDNDRATISILINSVANFPITHAGPVSVEPELIKH